MINQIFFKPSDKSAIRAITANYSSVFLIFFIITISLIISAESLLAQIPSFYLQIIYFSFAIIINYTFYLINFIYFMLFSNHPLIFFSYRSQQYIQYHLTQFLFLFLNSQQCRLFMRLGFTLSCRYLIIFHAIFLSNYPQIIIEYFFNFKYLL